jgi:ankyrin repeat protein
VGFCLKKQQLKPEHLQNEVVLLKDKNRQTAWHMAVGRSHAEVLSKLSLGCRSSG